MKEATRRRRAVLRDRQRDNRDEARYGEPLIRALTGWDLYILDEYATLERAAYRLVDGPGCIPAVVASPADERARLLAQHAGDPDKCPLPECLCHLREGGDA